MSLVKAMVVAELTDEYLLTKSTSSLADPISTSAFCSTIKALDENVLGNEKSKIPQTARNVKIDRIEILKVFFIFPSLIHAEKCE